MRIRFNTFLGQLPKLNDYALPESNAVSAVNCDLSDGFVRPLASVTDTGTTLALTGHDVAAIFKWDVGSNSYWFRFQDAVSVIRSPIADDAYYRVYWSGDSRSGGDVLYTYNPAAYTGGTEYPVNYYKLGIPKPTVALTAVASGTPPENPNDEQRFYVYTYVDKMGAESPPSSPSNAVIVANTGATVALSGITLDSGASTGREIEKIRIYRTLVGTSANNAEFLFVAEITSATTSYSDSVDAADLGGALPSVTWYPPRTGMQGLIVTAYRVAAGFYGNIICLSEINRPYAWPRDYELTTMSDIVALGHYDAYIIAATKSRPVTLTGIDPSSMSQMELPIVEACASARSMVSMGYCAVYASPNGLVMASEGTAALVTESIIGWRQWADLNPSSIHAYQHRNRYLFFWKVDETHKGAYFFNPSRPEEGFIALNHWFPAGYRDPLTDTLYLIDESKKLWTLSDTSNTPEPFTWKSKQVMLPRPGMMVAGRILADDYTDIHVKVYADGILHHERDVTDDAPFSMPRAMRRRNWQVEVTCSKGAVREVAIAETRNEIGSP